MLTQGASELNLPVTAFIVRSGPHFMIRWFTSDDELSLCGHGSLAAAAVIFKELLPQTDSLELHSPLAGILPTKKVGDLIELNFPAKVVETIVASEALVEGLGIKPTAVYRYQQERILVLFDNEQQVEMITPDITMLKALAEPAIVVTAPGDNVDFVSRTFYPNKTIYEDPVTGSSHCLLVPFWAKKLNKTDLHALQLSKRGGELICKLDNERVLIRGRAAFYAQGIIQLS